MFSGGRKRVHWEKIGLIKLITLLALNSASTTSELTHSFSMQPFSTLRFSDVLRDWERLNWERMG